MFYTYIAATEAAVTGSTMDETIATQAGTVQHDASTLSALTSKRYRLM